MFNSFARDFLRYACLQNPHLRLVNSVFSGYASLELHLFIHLLKSEGDFWVTLAYMSFLSLDEAEVLEEYLLLFTAYVCDA